MPTIDKPSAHSSQEIELIKRMVAEEFDIDVSEIDRETRIVPIPMIRFVAMTLVRELIPSAATSLPLIARAFKRSHHGTVINAVATIKDRRDTEPAFKRRIGALKTKIKTELSKLAEKTP